MYVHVLPVAWSLRAALTLTGSEATGTLKSKMVRNALLLLALTGLQPSAHPGNARTAGAVDKPTRQNHADLWVLPGSSANPQYAGNIDFLTSREHPSGFWGCSSSIVEAALVALPLLNGFFDSALRLRDTPSSCCLQWLVRSVQRATWSVARTSSGCTASFSGGVMLGT